MVTLKDIARVCGVSASSVSRALNNHSDISDERKELIWAAAEKMGYRQKAKERSRIRSFLVGLLETEDSETLFNDLLTMEIKKCLAAEGYDLVLLSSVERAGRRSPAESEKKDSGGTSAAQKGEKEGKKSALKREQTEEEKQNVDRTGVLYRARFFDLEGIFLLSNVKEAELYHMQELKSLRRLAAGEIPVVTVGSSLSSWGSVMPDYEEGLARIFRRIYRAGHRRIALVYGNAGEKAYGMDDGIVRAASEIGLDLSASNIRGLAPEDEKGAFQATLDILKKGRWLRPSCVVFGDDYLMQGGTAAIHSLGLSVPDDLSVVSMRCMEFRGHAEKELSCWDLNLRGIAEEAVEMMLREIEFPGSASRQTRLVKGRMREGGTLRTLKMDFI